MAHLPRYAIIDDNSTFHVTWQCHNHDWLLEKDWAKQTYYNLLLEFKDRYQIKIYSYCFMSNHPHLTGHCAKKKLLSDFFRVVNGSFARAYNKRMRRKGQVVMDRFKSPRIQTDADLLQVMRYIDLNPKRAGMVSHPKHYKWTSFHFYAYGQNDPLLTPAPSYQALGRNPQERQINYLALVTEVLKSDWKQKKPYSSVPFIGNPDWVIKRQRELKVIQQAQRIKRQRNHAHGSG